MENKMIDVVIKLVSSEEIFTSIVKIEGEMITFIDPMKISKRYTETPTGMSIQLNYEPFLDYSNSSTHTFHRQHVMSCEPLVPRLCSLYAEMKASTINATKNTSDDHIPLNVTIH